MENEPLKPGQIRLSQVRRVSKRRKFEDMMNAPITSVDDALSFIDVIEKQMPAVKKVLQKVRMNTVFSNSRSAAQTKPAMQSPIRESYDESTVVRTPDVQAASKIQGATEEQRRIQQLKSVTKKPESKTAQMPGIPGVSEGPRKMPEPAKGGEINLEAKAEEAPEVPVVTGTKNAAKRRTAKKATKKKSE